MKLVTIYYFSAVDWKSLKLKLIIENDDVEEYINTKIKPLLVSDKNSSNYRLIVEMSDIKFPFVVEEEE